MRTSDKGRALIMRFEGFVPTPYLCPANYLTVGYGHVIRKGEVFPPGGISHMQAEKLLDRDLAKYEADVRRLCPVPLTQGQFDALVSFTFNLGAGALQRSTLRRKVNRGEHEEVPREFLKWVYGGGKKLPGLVKRRAAEAVRYQE